jgi:leucyl-tRNA synthetase
MTAGLVGVTRFLDRVWTIHEKVVKTADMDAGVTRLLHKTIKKVSADTKTLNFNTAISRMMIYSTELAKLPAVPEPLWEPLVIMLAAYAPHIGEELWERLGRAGSVSGAAWPSYDEALAKDDELTIVVQVNGKIRDKFSAAAGTTKESLEKTALSSAIIQKWLDGKSIVKVIAVQDKLVNIVVK